MLCSKWKKVSCCWFEIHILKAPHVLSERHVAFLTSKVLQPLLTTSQSTVKHHLIVNSFYFNLRGSICEQTECSVHNCISYMQFFQVDGQHQQSCSDLWQLQSIFGRGQHWGEQKCRTSKFHLTKLNESIDARFKARTTIKQLFRRSRLRNIRRVAW